MRALFILLALPAFSQNRPCALTINLAGDAICIPFPTLKAAMGGAVGATGPQGIQGIKGDKGDQGPQGIPGPAVGFGMANGGVDTASIQSVDNAERGTATYCKSSNGNTAYSCKLQNKKLDSYQEGMQILLWADVPCAGGCSLNIDGVGQRALKDATGGNDAKFAAGFHHFDLDPSGTWRLAY